MANSDTVEIKVRTSLKTKLVLHPLRSQSILEIKGIIKYLHRQAFPEHGEIHITKLKVYLRDGKSTPDNLDVIGDLFPELHGKISIKVAKEDLFSKGPEVREVGNSSHVGETSIRPKSSLQLVLDRIALKKKAQSLPPPSKMKLSPSKAILNGERATMKSSARKTHAKEFWDAWDKIKQRRQKTVFSALKKFQNNKKPKIIH